MSTQAVSLPYLLIGQPTVSLDLDALSTNELKRIARFWIGTTLSNKYRKEECRKALSEVFRDRSRIEAAVRSLPEKERQVLAVCKRYGGTISGSLMLVELRARGLVEKEREPAGYRSAYRREKDDPVERLQGKLLLVAASGYSRYSFSFYGSTRTYPQLSLHPAIQDLIQPAPPLPWKPSAPAKEPTETYRRSTAEVALDLWTIAQALLQSGNWKTNRGGTPARSVQNRLQKVLPGNAADPFSPPNPEILIYELLHGLGAIQAEGGQGEIKARVVESHLRCPAALQSWHQVRAWIKTALWQDGIGLVPDRDSDYDPVRIQPSNLIPARRLLVWALCRVVNGTEGWLDLETFLADLWAARGSEHGSFYWSSYSWDPDFKRAREKDKAPVGPERYLAFWLDSEGSWAANALLGTLAHLGLVERGHHGEGRKRHYCFRLTELGEAVFGAPDRMIGDLASEVKFLTVQPNFEVLAHLDHADASAVWPLACMARRTSSADNRVQTFALTRESVYQALESGLSVDEVRRFLLEHSKTGLPDNVAQSLAEWGRRRETLVLRTGVSVGAHARDQANPFASTPRSQPLGEQFLLLPRTTARGVQGCLVLDHHGAPRPSWHIDDDGMIQVDEPADSLSLARLGQFTERAAGAWKITAASVRRARAHGIPAEQLLGWLREYLVNELPAIVETALRNWSSPAGVFLGNLLLLQVPQKQACAAILGSERFRPLLQGHIPPDWFLVHPGQQAELTRLLSELGFALGHSWKLEKWPSSEGAEQPSAGQPARKRGRPRRADWCVRRGLAGLPLGSSTDHGSIPSSLRALQCAILSAVRSR